jgi:hypothetical protein
MGFSLRMGKQSLLCLYVCRTICRHAFFGVILYASSVQLGTRLDTVPYVKHSYLYHMSLLSPRHVVQHNDINASRHAQSV